MLETKHVGDKFKTLMTDSIHKITNSILTVVRANKNENFNLKIKQDINGYQTVDCHNQYPITDQDVEQGKAVNSGNLQATMDYLLEGHPQGAVTSCQSCNGTGYIDPEVSQGLRDEVRPTT